jgi:hypothetical protein
MPLLRGRRDDGGMKYRMREKLFAIGDDYWIENDEGERAFKVDGKAMRIRKTLVLEDPPARSCSRSRRRSCTSATRWTSSGAARRSPGSRKR